MTYITESRTKRPHGLCPYKGIVRDNATKMHIFSEPQENYFRLSIPLLSETPPWFAPTPQDKRHQNRAEKKPITNTFLGGNKRWGADSPVCCSTLIHEATNPCLATPGEGTKGEGAKGARGRNAGLVVKPEHVAVRPANAVLPAEKKSRRSKQFGGKIGIHIGQIEWWDRTVPGTFRDPSWPRQGDPQHQGLAPFWTASRFTDWLRAGNLRFPLM
jgi:hypothetical protein